MRHSMKTIGLLGGMSWESSIEYYRIVNEAVRERLGGFHSARCLMYSVDFAEVEALQERGAWNEAAKLLAAAAQRLERGGADFVVICTNTMHKLAGDVEAAVGIPLLHIADATAEAIKAEGLSTVGLLGTRFTMEEDFYRGRLEERHGLHVIVPGPEQRERVHRVIYDELVVGEVHEASRMDYAKIAEDLRARGAEGVILGCTEIGLLLKEGDVPLPLFDTARIHALSAVEMALAEAEA